MSKNEGMFLYEKQRIYFLNALETKCTRDSRASRVFKECKNPNSEGNVPVRSFEPKKQKTDCQKTIEKNNSNHEKTL